MRYISELRVDGFAYAAIGNSTSKKDAQANAARDFCQYLVRTNEVQAEEVPGLQPTATEFAANVMPPMGGGPPSGPPPGKMSFESEIIDLTCYVRRRRTVTRCVLAIFWVMMMMMMMMMFKLQ